MEVQEFYSIVLSSIQHFSSYKGWYNDHSQSEFECDDDDGDADNDN